MLFVDVPRQYIRALALLALFSGCILLRASPRNLIEAQIGSIHIKGQKRFSEPQIVRASGLSVGQAFDVSLLNAATQELGETGAFEEVTFSYRSLGGRVAVEFTVKEAAKFHRCSFDNFVWASERELQDYLKKEISLYDGYAPEGGNLTDQIAASLERLNQSHGLPSKVESIHFGALGDPNWVFKFQAAGVTVKIVSVQFQGVKQLDEGLLRRAAQPLSGKNYSNTDAGLFAGGTFLPIYKNRGFLQAQCGAPSASVTRHLEGTADFEVQLLYSVDEGLAYNWQDPDWSGNQILGGAKLNELMGIKAGHLADSSKIDNGWEALQKAYSSRGYMDFAIKFEPVFDDPGRSVRYKAAISEGPQYHMGSFSITGVPSATAEKLKDRWPLKPADVYDASYLPEFQRNVILPALGSGSHVRLIADVHPDRNTLTVNVVFRVE